jgi:tRNA threonylcarbamoyladenosine biosynthesis protein TsaB
MYVLAIETTGKYGSVSLSDGSGRFATHRSDEEMNHLRDVISLADRCLTDLGIRTENLDYVAASVGPGSFTGIRIGVSTARAMAQMLGVPCVAVPTLDGMAEKALEYVQSEYVCTIINARRKQTYGAIRKIGDDGKSWTDHLKPGQYMIDEICEKAIETASMVCFTGDGVDAYGEIITESIPENALEIAGTDVRYQDAEAVCRLANKMIERGEGIVSYDELMPDYMRKSEAETKLEEGSLSSKIGMR